jgi:MarR family 2-MHQ and catechol resistance regulon transcriptional repressor
MKNVSGVHLWLILMKAHHALMALTARTLEQSGLGDSDFRVLEVLLHKGPLPVNVIGPKVFLTPGSISTAVERLFEKGLVVRRECEIDRRVRYVDLTAEGRTLVTRVFQEHEREMDKLASVLSPVERVQLAESLKKLGKRAEE